MCRGSPGKGRICVPAAIGGRRVDDSSLKCWSHRTASDRTFPTETSPCSPEGMWNHAKLIFIDWQEGFYCTLLHESDLIPLPPAVVLQSLQSKLLRPAHYKVDQVPTPCQTAEHQEVGQHSKESCQVDVVIFSALLLLHNGLLLMCWIYQIKGIMSFFLLLFIFQIKTKGFPPCWDVIWVFILFLVFLFH